MHTSVIIIGLAASCLCAALAAATLPLALPPRKQYGGEGRDDDESCVD